MKRLIDVTVSTTLLIVLSPIIGILSLKVKKQMGTPVLFKQQRPGLHEQSFHLCKFRTMENITDENGQFTS